MNFWVVLRRDKKQDKRSFEAIVTTVFKPESYRKISEDKNVIESKQVALIRT